MKHHVHMTERALYTGFRRKFHPSKGIGALYVRHKAPFSPYVDGGHQERNQRGSTESVPT